jgi:hypothetical protein
MEDGGGFCRDRAPPSRHTTAPPPAPSARTPGKANGGRAPDAARRAGHHHDRMGEVKGALEVLQHLLVALPLGAVGWGRQGAG